MAAKGTLGTEVAITATAPATFDDAGYSGITAANWEDCGEVTNVGEFGREYNIVRIMNLKTGATRKFKGSYDNGQVPLDLLFDSADDGQTLLETAETSTAKYSFRVQFPGGTGAEEFYFRALVASLKRVPGGPDDAIMLRASLEIDENVIVEGVQ